MSWRRKNTVFKLSNFVQCHSRRDSTERGNAEKIKLIIPSYLATLLSLLVSSCRGPGKPFIVSNWCRFCFLFMKTFLVYVTFIQLHFCLDPPRSVPRPGGRQPVQHYIPGQITGIYLMTFETNYTSTGCPKNCDP